ncbi:MAG: VOC family protein [Acidimicrobiales bacterium]
MVALGPHYHVGIVVPDLAAARVRLTEQLGVTWGPVLHLDATDQRTGDGTDVVVPTTMCHSTGEPCLELIQEVPGTVWVCNAHSNLHHIGFWSDDLAGDSTGLAAAGCPLQLCGRDGTVAPAAFAYHRDDELGVRVELVDAAMRSTMAFLFAPDASAG